MEPIKVVGRFLNGKRIKGFTQDFFSNKDRFHIYPSIQASGEPIEVSMRDLKAVFFVKDFAGNPMYDERKQYQGGEKPSGRKVEVIFRDGEVLIGSTLGYDPNRPGFFIFPADSKSNNLRIFAISTAVKNVRYL